MSSSAIVSALLPPERASSDQNKGLPVIVIKNFLVNGVKMEVLFTALPQSEVVYADITRSLKIIV
jgi:hypothetical protein